MSRAQQFLLPTKKDGAVAIDAVVFNGTSTIVNCGSDAGLDDLADSAFTVELWVNISSSMAGSDKIIGKGWTTSGWDLNYNDVAGGRLYADVACATTNAESNTSIALNDDTWHHITMFFDDAITDTESKARSLLFCGEERIKKFPFNFLWHSRTVVPDAYYNIFLLFKCLYPYSTRFHGL